MTTPACPSCGQVNDAVSCLDGTTANPVAGDASVCLGCGKFLIFTGEGLCTRLPTDAELQRLEADPQTRRARLTVALFNMARAARWN